MKIFVETKRFILREIEKSDADDMFELDSNPRVHQFLGNNPVKTIEQIEKVIDFIRQQYKKHGIGRWAVIEKSSNKFAGWAGLKYETGFRKGLNYYDLGYRLKPEFWGQGVATETAIASLNYGFDVLKLEKICAAAHVDNHGSNAVLKKIGFKLVEVIEYEKMPVNWYECEQDRANKV